MTEAAQRGDAMAEAAPKGAAKGDVHDDFLLCNLVRDVPLHMPAPRVYREEWAGARGKVELAEAFFRGEKIGDKELQKVFDLCLHCMTCEENCPSGMRADEIVMAVRAEMGAAASCAVKRAALWALGGADSALFKMARALGVVRRAPLHGVARGGPLSFLYPLLGWPRERFIPLPAAKPFLGSGPEIYLAEDVGGDSPDPEQFVGGGRSRRGDGAGEGGPRRIIRNQEGAWAGVRLRQNKAAALIELIIAAREKNLPQEARLLFVGHAVNQFFPEEARAVTRLLNMLGIDVLAPKNQVCCGAPVYHAGTSMARVRRRRRCSKASRGTSTIGSSRPAPRAVSC